jgi:hypothetical protein
MTVHTHTHTPGPWRADQLPSGDYRIIYNATRNWLAEVYCDGESEAAKADAALIAEAGTVATETGLTPRQLAERCKVLLAAAIKVRSWLAVERCSEPLEVIDSALRGIGVAEVPCPECEGAGEWDEGPLPATSSVQISPDYRQVKCPECSGTGRSAIAKTGGAA